MDGSLGFELTETTIDRIHQAFAAGTLTARRPPRWRPDGRRNQMFVQRLKDKLANKSNASSEVEYDGASPECCTRSANPGPVNRGSEKR